MFSVLFPVRSQFKRGKQGAFPVFCYLDSLLEIKIEKLVPEVLKSTGNVKNSGNESFVSRSYGVPRCTPPGNVPALIPKSLAQC